MKNEANFAHLAEKLFQEQKYITHSPRPNFLSRLVANKRVKKHGTLTTPSPTAARKIVSSSARITMHGSAGAKETGGKLCISPLCALRSY